MQRDIMNAPPVSLSLEDVVALVKPHHDRIIAEGKVEAAARLLEEIVGHLGAAVVQLVPSDDAIISDHLKKAETLAVQALRRLQGR